MNRTQKFTKAVQLMSNRELAAYHDNLIAELEAEKNSMRKAMFKSRIQIIERERAYIVAQAKDRDIPEKQNEKGEGLGELHEHDKNCRYIAFGLWDCGVTDQH